MAELHTLEDAAELLGTTPSRVDELWRMLGLRRDPAGLSGEDVRLLALLLRLVRGEGGDEDGAALLARSFGHHTARLVTWQVLGLAEVLGKDLPPQVAARRAAEVTRRDLPSLERLLVGVWRRHVEAVLDWRLGREEEQAHELVLSVGFSDLVDYTRLASSLDGRGVAELVRAFEHMCVEVVSSHGGRIVKMLGDEVLYVADDVAPAVAIGLELSDRAAASDLLPPVRAGVATGAVTAALGDVFGTTVNVAHRMTQAAEPGAVLVDAATAAAVQDLPGLVLAPRSLLLQGLGDVPVWAVTRPVGAAPPPAS